MSEQQQTPTSAPPHVPHPPPHPIAHQPHVATPVPGMVIPAEFWISLVIGIIVLFTFPRFSEYVFTRSHPDQFSWKFSDAAGMPLKYPKTAFFYPDMGLTVFGVVMILDALVLLRPRSAPMALLLLILTALSVALNVYAIIEAYSILGFQLYCALAAAYGGYMALYEWKLMQTLRLT